MDKQLLKGLLTGLLFPVIATYFYITVVLKTDISPALKQLSAQNLITQVLSLNVLSNIVPLFVYNNRREDHAVKGVVMASILYALIISIMYFL